MRYVICCWCGKNSDEFEKHVPLLLSGKRNLKLGFRNDIDILFLAGYDLLGEDYKQKLKSTGYELHDVSGICGGLERKYQVLDKFGEYEKKCFLRWAVISSYFPGESIIHYDGDIIFNEDPEVIGALLQGKTFVLQGCPALTSISDQAWFAQYQEQLDAFVNDIKGYSEKAWVERVGWEASELEKWAGQRFRQTISSDQDLLSHLIHTDRIVQDRPAEVLQAFDAYTLFENPMYLHAYENDLHDATYERRAGIDYINGRRVLIWHMQSSFNEYLGKFMFRRKYLGRGLKRLSSDLGKKDLVYYMHDFFVRYLRGKANSRLDVYRYFFEDHDLSEVLTDKTWWQAGAFA